MNRAYLLLGSNLDDRPVLLEKAKELISRHVGPILSFSSVYESEPWGFHADSPFLNQAIIVDTRLEPGDLLISLQQIENALGRRRTQAKTYQSRRIDIDILFYNDSVIHSQDLDIPHPRLHERRFALLPLCELNENHLHPGIQKTIRQLLSECGDQGKVMPFAEVPGQIRVK